MNSWKPKENNCKEMATWICYKCSFCLAVPICPTWVKSDWFWTIKGDTVHPHQLLCLCENNELSDKRGCESGCSNKIQHWPSEVTCAVTPGPCLCEQLVYIHDRIDKWQGH